MTTSRILRVLALAAALAVPATLIGALPASAADHFTVDNDGVVVRGDSGGPVVFNGSMESWHDGANLRATLNGTFLGNGLVVVSFVFSSGADQTWSMASNGTAKNVLLTSASGRSVVHFTVEFEPVADTNCPNGTWFNTGTNQCDPSAPPTVRKWYGYVGDAPDSHGACDQLDNDEMNLQQSGFGTFFGNVVYGCTSDGIVTASVRGTLYWGSQAVGSSARVEAVFTYADSRNDVTVSRTFVTSSSPQAAITLGSSALYNVRSVRVIVRNDNVDGPAATVKFGDA